MEHVAHGVWRGVDRRGRPFLEYVPGDFDEAAYEAAVSEMGDRDTPTLVGLRPGTIRVTFLT